MPEQSDLDRRLRAVERALTDGDHDVAALNDAAELADRLEDAEDRIATLEQRTADLDAAVQAVRGYVGNVRSVNEDVEERADAALAAVDRIERRLDDSAGSGSTQGAVDSAPRTRTSSDQNGRQQETEYPHPQDRDEIQHAIEMPPPGSRNTDAMDTDGESDDRSVIERVREAL